VTPVALTIEANAQRVIQIDELQTFLIPWKALTMQTIHNEHVLNTRPHINQNARHRQLADPDMLHSYQPQPAFNRQVRMPRRVKSSECLQNHRDHFSDDLTVV
jgi:hypothetical protein